MGDAQVKLCLAKRSPSAPCGQNEPRITRFDRTLRVIHDMLLSDQVRMLRSTTKLVIMVRLSFYCGRNAFVNRSPHSMRSISTSLWRPLAHNPGLAKRPWRCGQGEIAGNDKLYRDCLFFEDDLKSSEPVVSLECRIILNARHFKAKTAPVVTGVFFRKILALIPKNWCCKKHKRSRCQQSHGCPALFFKFTRACSGFIRRGSRRTSFGPCCPSFPF